MFLWNQISLYCSRKKQWVKTEDFTVSLSSSKYLYMTKIKKKKENFSSRKETSLRLSWTGFKWYQSNIYFRYTFRPISQRFQNLEAKIWDISKIETSWYGQDQRSWVAKKSLTSSKASRSVQLYPNKCCINTEAKQKGFYFSKTSYTISLGRGLFAFYVWY